MPCRKSDKAETGVLAKDGITAEFLAGWKPSGILPPTDSSLPATLQHPATSSPAATI